MPNLAKLKQAQSLIPNANEVANMELSSGEGETADLTEAISLLQDIKAKGGNIGPKGEGDPLLADAMKDVIAALPEPVRKEWLARCPNFPDVIANTFALINPSEDLSDEDNNPKSKLIVLVDDLLKILQANQEKGEVMANLKMELFREAAKDTPDKKKDVPLTSYEKEKKKEEGKRGKGQKSNPFKFLLGQVEKLYDRNWSKSSIERHISKHNRFDRGMVTKAYEIVRKRKKQEERKESTASFNLREILASTFEPETVYDVEPNINLFSTRDLILRLQYLTACANYDKEKDSGSRNNTKTGDLSSVDDELNKIKEALSKRDFNDADLKHLAEDVKSDPYYPHETLTYEGE